MLDDPAAHLQTLTAPKYPARRAVIALPGQTNAAVEMARSLGGGDGPAPIVDLNAPGPSLPRRLALLTADGIETLQICGDAPGFGLELAARWPGRLIAPPPRQLGDPLERDPVLLASLAKTTPQALALNTRTWTITGMDGAGKSTHLDRLAQRLANDGARVEVFKLYRQGAFLDLANELSARVAQGAPLATFRLSRVVKLIDSIKAFVSLVERAPELDVVLLDRWTETHLAAAESQLEWDLHQHPAMSLYPTADRTAWLQLDPQIAEARIEARGERRSADEHPAGLAGYARCFARLVGLRLDATAAFETNHARLRTHLSDAWPPSGPPQNPPAPPGRAPDATDGPPCRVTLGWDPQLPVLGASVLELRQFADLDHAPTRFWLEAWAAQTLLDIRCQRPRHACAPFWPAAAVAAWPHLRALSELAHLLEHEARVVGVGDLGPAPWMSLGPGAARLARQHAHQIQRQYP